jgi:3-hydroxybutyryl-CoA dehydrogenase
MKIFILSNEQQKKEILSTPLSEDAFLTFASSIAELNDPKSFDAFFILTNDELIDFEKFDGKPVYINEVIETLSGSGFPNNVSRINGWPGFLERPLWEVISNNHENHEKIFNLLNRKIIIVKDEPGFVSVRVISMIVNEAFFAFGEKISTIEEIDEAMKLGTNYPNGPFEWAEKIGVENIYNLLERLAEKEERYLPAPALKNLYLEISERIEP